MKFPDSDGQVPDHLNRLMSEARAQSRGYATYWEWPIDRPRAELQAATVLRNFLVAAGEAARGHLRRFTPDPPDVLLVTIEGMRIGIEVTELVDSEAVARHRHRKKFGQEGVYDWAQWTSSTVAKGLERTIAVKERKLAKVRDKFDELFLAIICDEPMIDEAGAREAIELCRPTAELIRRAFLLLSYHPQANAALYPDGCPVLPLRLL